MCQFQGPEFLRPWRILGNWKSTQIAEIEMHCSRITNAVIISVFLKVGNQFMKGYGIFKYQELQSRNIVSNQGCVQSAGSNHTVS